MALSSKSPSAPPDIRHRKRIETSKAPAISRAAAILRLLGKSDLPLGVHAIARELALVPSTCLHVLRALVAEELVAFDDDTKRYSLDAGVLTLARHWLRRNRFADLAQPALDEISETYSATTLGVRIVGLDHMIVVALAQSQALFQLSTQIGSRFPALISATGRCIAAFGDYPEQALEAGFKTLRWDEPPTLEEWKAQVAETRARGFAVDQDFYISGVTVVAAPVWGTGGKLHHALVAIGLSSQLRKAGIDGLADRIMRGAQTLSRQMTGEDER